ncbi:MAG: hypothetical protein ACRCWJ_16085 [Casimicrobium sp.]
MITRAVLKLIASIGFLLSSSTSVAEDFFTVVFDLSRDGKVFSSPKVVTESGSLSFVKVSGSNAINLAFVVYAMPNRQIKIMATIDTARGSAAPGFVTLEEQPVEFQLDDFRGRIVVYRNKI